jgi:dipeptidyl aminopeptidase/acylaminoacyl peptidase
VSAVPEAQADLDWVADALPGTVWRIDRARGDRRWHACGVAPDAPVRCAWFDRDARRVVFTREEPLTAAPGPLPRTIPVVLPTSDGLALDSYLVLPPGVSDPPAEPLPAVVLLHGGPYARTTYEPDPLRAYLASRGLAVLDLNFRGSTGQGVEVLTGADGERGLATQRDVREASAWLVDQGVADPRRLALMGHSFGGYSTLLGLAQEPGRYRCGVALAPMAGWSYRWLLWLLPRRQRERLPTTQLEQLVDPVFLAHAADDRVLPVGESRHVARALTRLGRPVTYLELDQGGHDLAAHADALGVAAADFLSACLGDDPAWAPAAAGDTPRP